MDEFLNSKENNGESPETVITETQTEETQDEALPQQSEEQPAELETEAVTETAIPDEEPFVYNPVQYSTVNPVEDYKPMSKGLKVFALLMALVILLTGSCITGYFIGKNSVKTLGGGKVSVNLSSRPKDTDELTEAQVYEKVNKSIVGIVIYNSEGLGSQASGIVYSDSGYIITNDHIYSEVPSAKFKIYAYDGKEYDAEYVAGDVISDLAVLKIAPNKLEPAEFGNSDEIFHGEHVVAVGRPSDATDNSSITRGIISAVSRRVQNTSSYSARLIQTDSAINPGSSGGALVNMYGQVIGVTSSKLASVEYDAVGYAIPTTTMKRIADELISKGRVETRAKLGITYTAIDSVTAEINGYDYVGLYIASVSEDSDLYGKAEEGDVITHINGIAVTSDEVVLDIIEQSAAGDKITVTIVTEDGKTKTVEAVLKANVSESSYTTESAQNKLPGNSGGNGSGSGNGGIFDFPEGE
ncbi:MAG: trypsin-like peptidase domain-containing protein [Clostridia bacterium]|nr:trypsin-like peptidase domain-containing protein [Clostridia bacterium]